MSRPPAERNAYSSIRNAALESFARDGVAATSIRSVAADAGVSPGLVQHHFPSKAALRAAVNEHVVALATDWFAEPPPSGPPRDVQRTQGDRLTEFVREHPNALRYVARAAADRDEGALAIFDAFVAIAHRQWETLADARQLRRNTDLKWAALHVVVLNLGTILLHDAIERHLDAPLLTAEELERWNHATNELFERGMYRLPTSDAASSR